MIFFPILAVIIVINITKVKTNIVSIIYLRKCPEYFCHLNLCAFFTLEPKSPSKCIKTELDDAKD